MPLIGGWLLLVAAFAAGIATIIGIAFPRRAAILRWCQAIAAVAAVLSLAALAWLVAKGNPDVAYAVENQAPPSLGWGYRIAAVWAGQSGGLMLWCVETALIGLLLSAARRPRAVAVLCGIETCLLILAALSAPFAASTGAAGAGLNPLLQHPMMLIHPPMLFLGYALLAMPFALTAASLIERAPQRWSEETRPWLLVAWLALTAGNGFGALWAYHTFGWGGFWSWDPVENTSFVPWVLVGVTVHAIWLAKRRPRWLRIAAVCALGAFLSVLYGSFLARSGVLSRASVHAYARGDRLMFHALSILLIGGFALAAVALARGWSVWRSHGEAAGGRAASVAWGNAMLLAIGVLVLAGMSLPAVGLVPTPSTYNATLIPLALVMAGTLALAMLPARWRPERFAAQVAGFVFSLTVGGVIYSITVDPAGGWLQVLPVMMAPLLSVGAVLCIILGAAWLIRSPRPILQRGPHVAHIGVGALIVGAILAGYQSESGETFVPLGKQAGVLGREVAVQEVVRATDKLTRARVAIGDDAGWVEVEQHESFNMPLRRAWVRNHIWGDVYITPLALLPEQSDDDAAPTGAMLEVTVKPGMPLVWGGLIAIALGAAMALLTRTFAARSESLEKDNPRPAVRTGARSTQLGGR